MYLVVYQFISCVPFMNQVFSLNYFFVSFLYFPRAFLSRVRVSRTSFVFVILFTLSNLGVFFSRMIFIIVYNIRNRFYNIVWFENCTLNYRFNNVNCALKIGIKSS